MNLWISRFPFAWTEDVSFLVEEERETLFMRLLWFQTALVGVDFLGDIILELFKGLAGIPLFSSNSSLFKPWDVPDDTSLLVFCLLLLEDFLWVLIPLLFCLRLLLLSLLSFISWEGSEWTSAFRKYSSASLMALSKSYKTNGSKLAVGVRHTFLLVFLYLRPLVKSTRLSLLISLYVLSSKKMTRTLSSLSSIVSTYKQLWVKGISHEVAIWESSDFGLRRELTLAGHQGYHLSFAQTTCPSCHIFILIKSYEGNTP